MNHILSHLQETSEYSNKLVEHIAANMHGNTFHHHYHLLYSLRDLINKDIATYTEIGTFNGGSLCLMLQHPKSVNIVSIDPFHLEQTNIEIVNANIKKFNKYNYNVTLTKKFSTDTTFIKELNHNNFTTDILFIDGDHSFNAVVHDFMKYSGFVNDGGFIVFDDYLDHEHSPEVRPAVDYIVSYIKIHNLPYEIIGSVQNFAGSKPHTLKYSNEFIIRKTKNSIVNDSQTVYDTINLIYNNDSKDYCNGKYKFGICMATYQRKNNLTKQYIERSLNNIINQTANNWHLYIVGDKYEDNDEFESLFVNFPKEKITYKNLPIAMERDNITNKQHLWCVGGSNAFNTAHKMALDDGCDYILHHDDDDIFHIKKIQILNVIADNLNAPSVLFHYSSHINRQILPNIPKNLISIQLNNYKPSPCNVIHSSFCIHKDIIKGFKYEGYVEGKQDYIAGDISLITYLNSIELCTFLFIPFVLCDHDIEGYMLRS